MQLKVLDRELPDHNRYDLRDALDELQDEGVVERVRGKGFRLAGSGSTKRDQVRRGVIHVHPRGFGFVRTAGLDDDMFINPSAIGGAMHGDEVNARLTAHGHRGPEGEIVEVLARGRERVVGVLGGSTGKLWLAPDDTRVRGPIEVEDHDGAQLGLAAVITIERYPVYPDELPRGRLLATLGVPGDPQVEVAKILLDNDIEEEHHPDAVAEAAACPDELSPAERAGRTDLTHLPIVTIDPADARDHDDAIWVERNEQGEYHVWIAIADVSHYVAEGGALDREAMHRGCSVYLPDRAIPMLPQRLAADLCSLKAGIDRPSMCIEVELDATGEVVSSKIHEAIVRSRAFMSYPSVARALGFTEEADRDPEAESRVESLRVLWDLCTLLRARRMKRGALDLDVPEARIELDESTKLPIGVTERAQDPGVRKAYRLVEEMMLLGNETVAAFMHEHKIPAIYRVHGSPDPQRIDRFAAVCTLLGVSFDEPFDGESAVVPKRLSKVMKKIRHHPKSAILSGLLLRALKRATYDIEDIGHFGLASPAYLHFTSPIRRYPDLTVHRAVRAHLRGQRKPASEEENTALAEAATRASERERMAMTAERSVGDLYRVLYMKARVGELFEARVTAFTSGGIYARIADPFVEILIPWEAFGGERYELDDLELRATAARSGEQVMLGDAVDVCIEEASIARRVVLARRAAFIGRAAPPLEETRGKQGRGRGRGVGRKPTQADSKPGRGKAAARSTGKRGRRRR